VPPVTRYAASGDLQIAYQVIGEGPRDLVVVPGFVSNVELLWEEPGVERFLERLASFARVVLYDKREQGLSDRLGRVPTLEDGLDDVMAVMDAAGASKAAVFGYSEGGPLATLFAAAHPERVTALVLYGSYARILQAPDYPVGISEQVLDAWLRVLQEGWGGPVGLEWFAPSRLDDERFAGWWARYLRGGGSPRTATGLIDVYRAIDVRDALSSIGVPTLVLHRADDQLVPAAQGRYLAEHIRGARYVELPGGDHFVAAGDPEPLADEIEEFLTGAARVREPDRVLATVLFTDIVGSTEQAGRLGDRRWRDLLAGHDELVRRQLTRFGGREVKTVGDGFLATFDGPARAVRCACAARDAVRRLGIELRAGVHTGECEVIGTDVGGIAVHIGARVAAAAAPGEVLVSSTVRDLVVGSDLAFETRGSHTLRGVPGEWRLFAASG
jgi:class 3 adenylate cyclase